MRGHDGAVTPEHPTECVFNCESYSCRQARADAEKAERIKMAQGSPGKHARSRSFRQPNIIISKGRFGPRLELGHGR